jgi:hypothetical protein
MIGRLNLDVGTSSQPGTSTMTSAINACKNSYWPAAYKPTTGVEIIVVDDDVQHESASDSVTAFYWSKISDLAFSPSLFTSFQFQLPAYFNGINDDEHKTMANFMSVATVGDCVDIDYDTIVYQRALNNPFQQLPSCSNFKSDATLDAKTYFTALKDISYGMSGSGCVRDPVTGFVPYGCKDAYSDAHLGDSYTMLGQSKIPTHWNGSGIVDGYMPTFNYQYNSSMTDLAGCRKQFYDDAATCDYTGTGITTGCAVDMANTYICEGGCPQTGNCCSTFTTETSCKDAFCQWSPSTIDMKFDLAVTSFGLHFPLLDDPGTNGGECRGYDSDQHSVCNSSFYGNRAGCEAHASCLWSTAAELSTLSSCAKTKVQASLQMQSSAGVWCVSVCVCVCALTLYAAVAKVYDVEERLSITVSSTYVACTKTECLADAPGYCKAVNDTPTVNCNQMMSSTTCGDAATGADQQCLWVVKPAAGFGPGRDCGNTPDELAMANKGFARLKTTVHIDILNTGTSHTLVVARDLSMKGGAGGNYESVNRASTARDDNGENCYGRVYTPGIGSTEGSSFVYSSIKLGDDYYSE